MNNGKLIIGIIVGAIVGLIAGILVAPSSGEKTIKRLKKESSRIKGEMEKEANQLVGKMKKEFDQRVETYGKEGRKTFNDLKEMVK